MFNSFSSIFAFGAPSSLSSSHAVFLLLFPLSTNPAFRFSNYKVNAIYLLTRCLVPPRVLLVLTRSQLFRTPLADSSGSVGRNCRALRGQCTGVLAVAHIGKRQHRLAGELLQHLARVHPPYPVHIHCFIGMISFVYDVVKCRYAVLIQPIMK
eukprot:TRINITY_DN13063_c0_g1_i1.p1 TRINITY_DN13063_c0_g1~~TRINITY_DN13063_c0_g1_i1.p1  ORF type:complete len:153 (-),score=1.39 TRINITY_DN13063_c0_g1_i1:132-590(-)